MFRFQSDGGSNDAEQQLDEEITKVFTMDADANEAFDVSKLHDSADSSQPRKYGEQDYIRKYQCFFSVLLGTYFYRVLKILKFTRI